MEANKKMTVKTLTEELFKLKDEVKELSQVKKKVLELEDAHKQDEEIIKEHVKVIKALEHKVDILQMKLNKNGNASKHEEVDQSGRIHRFNCKECGDSFESKSRLNKHVKEKHQKTIECNTCSFTCISNIDLEDHMKTHEQPKLFQYDICEKEFYLKWRLTKHREGHEQKRRYCHYFNNTQMCPYEENGCMFSHETSPVCSFSTKCTRKLCQFRHPSKSTDQPDKNSDGELNDDENSSDSEEESEIQSCNYCGQIYEEIEELIDHFAETGHNLHDD